MTTPNLGSNITAALPTQTARQSVRILAFVRGLSRVDVTVLCVAAAVLLLLVAYPVVWLILTAFGLPDAPSVSAIVTTFTNSQALVPLLNTVVLGVAVGVASALLGVPLAWLAARSNMPGRRFISGCAALSFIMPPYLTSLAYIDFVGSRSGYLNRLLSVFHIGPVNIYNMAGIVFVVTLHGFSLVYFLTYQGLRSVDSSLEEAARSTGAGHWRVLRKVTLPLVGPAILAGVLLAAMVATTGFGPQAFLGTPANIVFISTLIYADLSAYPPQFGVMAMLSLLLIVLVGLGLYVQRRYLGKRSFVTVSGRGLRVERTSLGAWRWPIFCLCVAVLTLATVVPLLTLITSAVSRDWFAPLSLGDLTLDNFRAALVTNSISRTGILNSFKLAAGAATITVFVGLGISYIAQRTALPGRRILDYLSVAPLGLPGSVYGFALILVCLHPPFEPFYSTIWLLLAAYVGASIPLATRATGAALGQVDPALEEASRIAGAGWLVTVRRILVPIMRQGISTGWLLVFIPSLSELSATIILYSSGNETISVALSSLNGDGLYGAVAALSVVTIGLTLIGAGIVRWLGGEGSRPGVGLTPS